MNAKHSPGPWKLLVGGGNFIYDKDMQRVAVVDRKEDAPLTVAAPELLAKLKDLYTRIHAFTMEAELMPGDLAVLCAWMDEIKYEVRKCSFL